jgi:hypothetical protein
MASPDEPTFNHVDGSKVNWIRHPTSMGITKDYIVQRTISAIDDGPDPDVSEGDEEEEHDDHVDHDEINDDASMRSGRSASSKSSAPSSVSTPPDEPAKAVTVTLLHVDTKVRPVSLQL